MFHTRTMRVAIAATALAVATAMPAFASHSRQNAAAERGVQLRPAGLGEAKNELPFTRIVTTRTQQTGSAARGDSKHWPPRYLPRFR